MERNVEELVRKGISLHKTQHFEKAIDAFSNALKVEPDNPTLYQYRASAWLKKGYHLGDAHDEDVSKEG